MYSVLFYSLFAKYFFPNKYCFLYVLYTSGFNCLIDPEGSFKGNIIENMSPGRLFRPLLYNVLSTVLSLVCYMFSVAEWLDFLSL